jgi:hypothetical protein
MNSTQGLHVACQAAMKNRLLNVAQGLTEAGPPRDRQPLFRFAGFRRADGATARGLDGSKAAASYLRS